MHFRSLAAWCVLGVLVLPMSAARGQAQEYKIVIDRPEKLGQRYTIHATGRTKQTATMTAPGAAPRTQSAEVAVELDGTIKVLAIDEKSGKPTKLECTVAKCLKDQKPLIDAGAVLTAENKQGKMVFTKEGTELDPDTSGVLSSAMKAHLKMTVKGADGQPIAVENDLDESKHLDFSPADK